MFATLDTIGSGLTAQRVRMDVIAGNLANSNSTMRADGRIEPYRRRFVVFEPTTENGGPGVSVRAVAEDPSPYAMRYDPGHPHAIQEGPQTGYVRYPNVSTTLEYVDAIEAGRAYEANLAMMTLTRGMIQQSIQMLA